MTPEMVLDIFKSGIYMVVILVIVLVTPGLIVGLIVAMFQAATQINEMSMSFVPKLIVTLLSLLITGPWIVSTVINFTERLIMDIPTLIG